MLARRMTIAYALRVESSWILVDLSDVWVCLTENRENKNNKTIMSFYLNDKRIWCFSWLKNVIQSKPKMFGRAFIALIFGINPPKWWFEKCKKCVCVCMFLKYQMVRFTPTKKKCVKSNCNPWEWKAKEKKMNKNNNKINLRKRRNQSWWLYKIKRRKKKELKDSQKFYWKTNYQMANGQMILWFVVNIYTCIYKMRMI